MLKQHNKKKNKQKNHYLHYNASFDWGYLFKRIEGKIAYQY
jgi:hypothetical protein